MTGQKGACVVAAYDGSAASKKALECAAIEAGPDGEVVIVHAFHPPGDFVGHPQYKEKMAAQHAEAQALLAGLADDGVPALKTTHWEPELIEGPPAEMIVRVAEIHKAKAIYLGSRGVGRARALLGSVSHDVIHRADVPVVVIPERAVR